MPYTPKHKPYNHQREALKRSLNKENFALTMEMGTGKTKVVADTFGYRLAAGDLNGLLVIARAGVYRLWENELKEHMDEEAYKDLHIGLWKGSPRKRAKMLESFFHLSNRRRPRVLLMNV